MTSGRTALRIGTRRSALARTQAETVARSLRRAGFRCSIVPMATRGDSGTPAPLSAGGVKGLFVDEIVKALLDGHIDVAVHSAKDLPAFDPEGIVVGAIPRRAPASDVLVTREERLGRGARVGTSSLRRRAQFMRSRPHLQVVEVRGNIDTRLARLEAGELDGLLLAQAGLVRLGIRPAHTAVLDLAEMLPAPAQGFLAIQTRIEDVARVPVKMLEHPAGRRAWEAERHLVRLLGADCALPVGAYARLEGGSIRLDAAVFSEDGAEAVRGHGRGEDPRAVAESTAGILLSAGAAQILKPYSTQAEAS